MSVPSPILNILLVKQITTGKNMATLDFIRGITFCEHFFVDNKTILNVSETDRIFPFPKIRKEVQWRS